tara:strand:- start:1454 stop:1777 length:324 start_codon:yes stop_codon:yes gene_type:complete
MTTRATPHFWLIATTLMLIFLVGCRRPYPQLPKEQLKFIQGIRTAANTRSKQRVDTVEQEIKKANTAGEIPPETYQILQDLLEDCSNANYRKAERKCVLLLKDQLLQ